MRLVNAQDRCPSSVRRLSAQSPFVRNGAAHAAVKEAGGEKGRSQARRASQKAGVTTREA